MFTTGYNLPLHQLHHDKMLPALLVVFTVVGDTFPNGRYIDKNELTGKLNTAIKYCSQRLSPTYRQLALEAYRVRH